jgi:predicted DNA-binding transcriptional regulator AlpA
MSDDQLDRFNRIEEVLKVFPFGRSELYQRIRDGNFPRPDAYLGPRMPVYLTSTLKREQAKLIAKPQAPRVKAGTKP